jgi:hypothetical protein
MPFQSEKQRRYLWANEPEIARDWTDTYGSGIAKALGGRIPFYTGSGVTSNIYKTPRTISDQNRILGRTFTENQGGIVDWLMNKGTGMTRGLSSMNENYLMPALAGVFGIANSYNPLSEGSQNYNPQLQGQIDQLQASGILGGYDPSGPYKITSGPLAGKNLVSAFGTNDYDEMLAKKISWFEKRKAEKKSISDKAYQKTIEEQKRREREKAQATQTWQNRYANWKSPSGRDHVGTAGIGSKESRQGGAPGSSKGEGGWKG